MPSLFTIVASVGFFLVTLQLLFEYYEGRLPLHYSRAVGALSPKTANTNMAAARQKPRWTEEIDVVCYEPERLRRLSYGSGPGAVVHGYPAKGGIYVLNKVSSVEVEFLGFDRFDTEASSDADTEEELCDNMRRLGAVWWKRQYDYHLSSVPGPDTRLGGPQKYIRVGWPAEGGVWVLNTTKSAVAEKGAGILYNAYSMAERCRVIEKLGGTFYENPKDCPDLDLP